MYLILMRYKLLADYTPRASLAPSTLDLTDCPFMWPYCDQPLYANAIAVIANLTILNAKAVSGKVAYVEWHPVGNGRHLTLTFTHSETVWPWTGYLAIHITVSPAAYQFEGVVEGIVELNITTDTSYQYVLVLCIGYLKHRLIYLQNIGIAGEG